MGAEKRGRGKRLTSHRELELEGGTAWQNGAVSIEVGRKEREKKKSQTRLKSIKYSTRVFGMW
jgi:hypothetical protein